MVGSGRVGVMDEKMRQSIALNFAENVFEFARNQDLDALPSCKKYFARKRKKEGALCIFIYFWANSEKPPIPMTAKILSHKKAKELFNSFERDERESISFLSVVLMDKKKILAIDSLFADDAHRLSLVLCGLSLSYLSQREAGIYLESTEVLTLTRQ